MAPAAWSRETEIKLRVKDAQEGQSLLQRAGFQPASARRFETNVIYDTPQQDLHRRGELLRLRSINGTNILTFKAAGSNDRYKVRPEIEVQVSDGQALAEILERLGFRPAFRYEKFRTDYVSADAGGHASLDETPIGTFIELEGDPGWIDQAAERLGFDASAYITATYAELFFEQRAASPGAVPAMVFPERTLGQNPETGKKTPE